MCHEVVPAALSAFRRRRPCCGLNLRMPELMAAVLLVQLRRLEASAGKHAPAQASLISDGIAETCRRTGVALQDVPDPDGDAAVCLIPLPAQRRQSAAGGRGAARLRISAPISTTGRMLWTCNATPIGAPLNQHTWTPQGGPWRWAQRPIEYSAGMCPRTLDLLGRGVSLNINPLYTMDDVAQVVAGVNRVLLALA